MNYFYSHLIEIESVTVKLDEMKLSTDQKKHLASLLDATIHQTILDVVLSKLSSQNKRAFIEQMKQDPKNKELMEFLKDKVDNIEQEIKSAVEDLKKELHEDIKDAFNRGVRLGI